MQSFLIFRKNKDLLDELPRPRLGFNGVSGKDAAELIRRMEEGGTVVTYGGMARQVGKFLINCFKTKVNMV